MEKRVSGKDQVSWERKIRQRKKNGGWGTWAIQVPARVPKKESGKNHGKSGPCRTLGRENETQVREKKASDRFKSGKRQIACGDHRRELKS